MRCLWEGGVFVTVENYQHIYSSEKQTGAITGFLLCIAGHGASGNTHKK